MASLRKQDLAAEPFAQFEQWLAEAVAEPDIIQPYAMTLATATPDGVPAARTVLLRGFDQYGFVFYSNYDSQKGHELAANPKAALVIYWANLNRQIRISGTIDRLSDSESDAYFQSRPKGSQLGAWVSRQSQIIENRAVLEAQLKQLEERYEGQPVPRPSFWGGYRLTPKTIDFWQSGLHRLHDWFRYSQGVEKWQLDRLSP